MGKVPLESFSAPPQIFPEPQGHPLRFAENTRAARVNQNQDQAARLPWLAFHRIPNPRDAHVIPRFHKIPPFFRPPLNHCVVVSFFLCVCVSDMGLCVV